LRKKPARRQAKSRLKAGCSQDWLPHNGFGISIRSKVFGKPRVSP
jgi:hypothetical protein